MEQKSDLSNKTDFMKYHVQSFIENEKLSTCLEQIDLKNSLQTGELKTSSSPVVKENKQEESNIKPVQVNIIEKERVQESTFESVSFSPKRYQSKCYIQPIHVPYWYTETVCVKIGSKKMRYKEYVQFKNKLIPFHWTEKMSTIVIPPGTGEPFIYKATLDIPVQNDIHYICLQAQQVAAGQEIESVQEISKL